MKYKGVHIDIGGPLRVSDTEMNACMKDAFIRESLLYYLEDREAWQLYGMFSSEGYVGFAKAAIAMARAGKPFKHYLQPDCLTELTEDVARLVGHGDDVMILRVAKRAEDLYNAAPSQRVQEDATEALQLLKSRGVALSCVTDTYAESAAKWLDGKFPGFFGQDFVFGKVKGATVAPNHKALKLGEAAKKMGLSPKETIYIADTRGDIIAARDETAGCDVGMVLNGMGFPESWSDVKPDYTFENLLRAAEFVVS